MRPILIVITSPLFHLLLGISQGQEPVLVQTLLADAGVEGLDEGVVRRLALLLFVPLIMSSLQGLG